MKMTSSSTSFVYFLVFALCFLPVCLGDTENTKSVMDLVPDDALAYVSLSNLESVYQTVVNSSEWQELLSIEGIEEDLDQAKQVLSFGPMLVGISLEDLLNSFGHETVFTFMGMMGPMPVAGLIVNAGTHMEQLEYAVEQLAILPTLTGQFMLEDKEYRGLPCTVIGNRDLKVKYGYLDGLLFAGLNGGFEKLIDFYKDGGRSIKETPNLKFMEQKVSLSSNICIYADAERAAPLVEMLANASQEDGAEDKQDEAVTEFAIESVKAIVLGLNLSGHTQEMYLHLRPGQQNPITDLVLAPFSPMSTVNVVPFDDGAMAGIHIGDPAKLLDRVLELMKFFHQETEEIERLVQQLENRLQIDLRDDLLSSLTGEIAVMAMLPKEAVDLKADRFQMAMQIAQTRAAVFVGVKDGSKLAETIGSLLELVDVEPVALEEQTYKGEEVFTKLIPLDPLVPGLALMPSYTFRDGLLVMSNKKEWVQDTIDLFELASATEIRGKLAESRVLMYLDIANIASFVVKQDLIGDIDVPEPAQDRLADLGSVAASLSFGPDGAGVKLVSMSEDEWIMKILRGVLVGVYSNIASEQTVDSGDSTSGWVVVDVNGGTVDDAMLRVENGVVQFQYQQSEVALLVNSQTKLTGFTNLKLRVKSRESTTLAVAVEDQDRARFHALVNVDPNSWQDIELSPDDFRLSDDSPVKKERLDTDQLGTAYAILDLAFTQGREGENTLEIGSVEAISE